MMLLAISGWNILNIILIAILLYMVGNWGYYKLRGRMLGGAIDNETFEQTMRKAQLIDLRDKKDFNAGHILGARNMPYTQYKSWQNELRKDLPVYLYETGQNISIRIAIHLKKAGFTDVKWLKDGYSSWEGKKKKVEKKY
ncbi:rhodanese-like domain-containing protein [Lapidilactobacillus wuchangensis]|uniref:rhodanese-like domain-containing protein n=1 Tax=Lapidilactobacillus wuchangensis TaxID=2486001 RepID=UPI000F768331|nr:rhodanese-like domain-containing protein [Lapidilactobacillus wuchangensis]